MKTCFRGHERPDTVLMCSECRKIRYKARRLEERVSNKTWIKNNLDHYREKQKKYRSENQEAVKRLYADWVKRNPQHSIWRNMKARCMNPKCKAYPDYGGRGISICERWIGENGYKNFEADMSPRPSMKHTINRIDNDKGYFPENCEWEIKEKQQRNMRANVMLTINGVTKCMTDWARERGLCVKTLQKRIRNKWPEDKLLIPADQSHRTIGRTGRKKSLAQNPQSSENSGEDRYAVSADLLFPRGLPLAH